MHVAPVRYQSKNERVVHTYTYKCRTSRAVSPWQLRIYLCMCVTLRKRPMKRRTWNLRVCIRNLSVTRCELVGDLCTNCQWRNSWQGCFDTKLRPGTTPFRLRHVNKISNSAGSIGLLCYCRRRIRNASCWEHSGRGKIPPGDMEGIRCEAAINVAHNLYNVSCCRRRCSWEPGMHQSSWTEKGSRRGRCYGFWLGTRVVGPNRPRRSRFFQHWKHRVWSNRHHVWRRGSQCIVCNSLAWATVTVRCWYRPLDSFLKIVSATVGGTVTNYSPRFSISGMTGTFSASVLAGLKKVKGTAGPPTENNVADPGPSPGKPEDSIYAIPFPSQSDKIMYAPMQGRPGSKITAKTVSPRYQTSSVQIATKYLAPPRQTTTFTKSLTISVESQENLVFYPVLATWTSSDIDLTVSVRSPQQLTPLSMPCKNTSIDGEIENCETCGLWRFFAGFTHRQ